MANSEEWYVRSEDGKVYGPADLATLVSWAEDGRVEPTGFVSKDRRAWTPSQLLAELQMKWLIELEPGKVFGPFNRAFAIKLFQSGSVPAGAKAYRLHELGIEQDPPPVIVEKIKEVPVEKIVEKVVEKVVEKKVPVEVEKIVEKIVEKEVIREVPVEKIVEKIVEVEPPPRTEIVVPEVVEAVGRQPPPSPLGGIFKHADRAHLEALESAARRELAAAKGGGRFGLFGRKK